MSLRKENFVRIAENRTNKIIEMIELLGNLSNKSYYEYTNAQINAVFDAIQNALDEQKTRFSIRQNTRKRFKL